MGDIFSRMKAHYGEMWNIYAPPSSTPLMIEGRCNVNPNPTPANSIIKVLHIAPSKGNSPIRVIHRIITLIADISPNDNYYSRHPFAEAGRMSWLLHYDGSQVPLLSEFLQSDGYVGYDVAGQNIGTKTNGISTAGEFQISPLVIEPGKSFDLILHIIRTNNGEPLAVDDPQRIFYARAEGYSIPFPPLTSEK